jgi:hypothetical protein
MGTAPNIQANANHLVRVIGFDPLLEAMKSVGASLTVLWEIKTNVTRTVGCKKCVCQERQLPANLPMRRPTLQPKNP